MTSSRIIVGVSDIYCSIVYAITKGLDEINLSPPTPRHKDLWPTHSIDQLQSHVFVSPIEKEVKKFESLPEASKDDDILKWWKFYSKGFPILSSVIRAILAINVVPS